MYACESAGMDHILFKVEILSNEDREWHESFSLVLGPDDPVEAVLGEITMATVTILDQEASGSLILPATPIVRNVHCTIFFFLWPLNETITTLKKNLCYPSIHATHTDT